MSKVISRRSVLAGAAVIVVAAGAAVIEGPKLLRPRHAPSPYDDLLDLLDNRDAAAQIGEAVLAGKPDFDIAKTAGDLRVRLKGKKLADVVAEEAAAHRVVEVGGWVMPKALAQLCALAAKVS